MTQSRANHTHGPSINMETYVGVILRRWARAGIATEPGVQHDPAITLRASSTLCAVFV